MTILVPNNGEGDALAAYVAYSGGLSLKLFGNNITPAETDVAGTYTEYAVAGYAPTNLVTNNWVITEGAPSSAAYPQITYTLTGAGDAYGYYLVRQTGGRIAAVERFSSGPFSVPSGGGTIRVTPQITFD